MRAYERFLKYVRIDTASDPLSETTPSSVKQFDLARELERELIEMGAKDVRLDEHCYLYAKIPANVADENLPKIGLIAHMDVVDQPASAPCRPEVTEPYAGGNIRLKNGDVFSEKDYPRLKTMVGKRLVVTDGKTTLGADDKAGVAEIMTLCERLLKGDRHIPHGEVRIAFTPDEEIGRGADAFDLEAFDADFAYTVDGDEMGTYEFENFNAASALIRIAGLATHPGTSKGVMKNALLIAMEFNSLLPKNQTPADTEGYEGFYHLCSLKGTVDGCLAYYIIRDHDRQRFEDRKYIFSSLAKEIDLKYGEGTVDLELVDTYYNMADVLKDHMDVVHRLEKAYRACGIVPRIKPIRGGTDGSKLSFMGLPCPNLASGCLNAHSRHEMVAVEDMDALTDVLEAIVRV